MKRAAKYVRPTIQVIDLEAHKATCLKCRNFELCPTGRGIVYLASSALYEASLRQMGARRELGRA